LQVLNKKTPKLSDLEVAALGLTAEYMMYILNCNYLEFSKGQCPKTKSNAACSTGAGGKFLNTPKKSVNAQAGN
jgi:hypothetical protein